jgi:hypothetical protein
MTDPQITVEINTEVPVIFYSYRLIISKQLKTQVTNTCDSF